MMEDPSAKGALKSSREGRLQTHWICHTRRQATNTDIRIRGTQRKHVGFGFGNSRRSNACFRAPLCKEKTHARLQHIIWQVWQLPQGDVSNVMGLGPRNLNRAKCANCHYRAEKRAKKGSGYGRILDPSIAACPDGTSRGVCMDPFL